jgi:probable phosphoglycerate mutase
MNSGFCTFYIVRHGQAELNHDDIVMGQINSPLTDLGKQQAKALAATFQKIRFDAVLVSDLTRAFDTACIITNSNGVDFHIDSRLRERSFGSLEGRPLTMLVNLREQSKSLPAEQMWEGKLVHDMESDQELFERVSISLKSFSTEHPDEKILAVTHSGPIRTLLMGLGFYKKDELKPGFIGHGEYVVIQMDETQAKLKGVYSINTNKSISSE